MRNNQRYDVIELTIEISKHDIFKDCKWIYAIFKFGPYAKEDITKYVKHLEQQGLQVETYKSVYDLSCADFPDINFDDCGTSDILGNNLVRVAREKYGDEFLSRCCKEEHSCVYRDGQWVGGDEMFQK